MSVSTNYSDCLSTSITLKHTLYKNECSIIRCPSSVFASSELDENKQVGPKKHWHSFKSRGRFPLEADEVRQRLSFTAQKTRAARADHPLPHSNVTRCFMSVVCGVLFRFYVRQQSINTSSGGPNCDNTLCCGILVLRASAFLSVIFLLTRESV